MMELRDNERIARAAEKIAELLTKLANPPMLTCRRTARSRPPMTPGHFIVIPPNVAERIAAALEKLVEIQEPLK